MRPHSVQCHRRTSLILNNHVVTCERFALSQEKATKNEFWEHLIFNQMLKLSVRPLPSISGRISVRVLRSRPSPKAFSDRIERNRSELEIA